MSNISIFPRTQPIEVCPICKTPLEETSHGWVRSYWPELAEEFGVPAHTIHTEKCIKRRGYCYTPCPMCTGGVEAKRQAQLINELFKDSNIPYYGRDWTFATFPEDADQRAMVTVRTRLSDWLAGKPTRGGLYLHGDNGECKTSLAISALHTWLKKGHTGVFIGTAELFSELRESIAASKRSEDYQDRYRASRGAKLLRLMKEDAELAILDDLGVEQGSPFEIRELYLILEARRSHGLFTIFTSNCDADDLAQHWRDEKGTFQDSKRIIARLGEYAFAIPLQGRNQRQK